jgi:hypothetical protein
MVIDEGPPDVITLPAASVSDAVKVQLCDVKMLRGQPESATWLRGPGAVGENAVDVTVREP